MDDCKLKFWKRYGSGFFRCWLGVSGNELHLAVVEFDSCSFTRTCNRLFSESCVDLPVLCRLSVFSWLLAPSYRLVGLAPPAAKCVCDKNCIRSMSRELFRRWRPQLTTRIVNPDDSQLFYYISIYLGIYPATFEVQLFNLLNLYCYFHAVCGIVSQNLQ